ncbi:MAG: hypothetical protein P4L16_04420 [Chlamydiales bacterium]|nr:hypothetical protein [Chlamydiales bacterium]
MLRTRTESVASTSAAPVYRFPLYPPLSVQFEGVITKMQASALFSNEDFSRFDSKYLEDAAARLIVEVLDFCLEESEDLEEGEINQVFLWKDECKSILAAFLKSEREAENAIEKMQKSVSERRVDQAVKKFGETVDLVARIATRSFNESSERRLEEAEDKLIAFQEHRERRCDALSEATWKLEKEIAELSREDRIAVDKACASGLMAMGQEREFMMLDASFKEMLGRDA